RQRRKVVRSALLVSLAGVASGRKNLLWAPLHLPKVESSRGSRRIRLMPAGAPRDNENPFSAAFDLGDCHLVSSHCSHDFLCLAAQHAGENHPATARVVLQWRTSPALKTTPPILFSCAFDFAVEIAAGSLSMPAARPAPRRFAANARIPLPVPRSMSDQPFFHVRVSCSSARRIMAVVTCWPVPNAAP